MPSSGEENRYEQDTEEKEQSAADVYNHCCCNMLHTFSILHAYLYYHQQVVYE